MARLFVTPINMNQNEVQNLRIQNLTVDPTSPAPVEGQLWYRSDLHYPVWRSNSASNAIYPFASTNTINTGVLRDGSGNFSAGTITASLTGTASQATALDDGTATFRSGSYYLDFSHTTGTRDHTAISDFDTQVRTSRLDQMAAPTASVSMNNQKITSLLDPTQPQDAATMAYVDSVAQGLDIKASSRIATTAGLAAYTYSSTNGGTLTANVNGAFPLTDDKTLALNESILVKNETAGNQKYNGIYTLTQVGSGSLPWILTRRSDANTSVKFTSGLYTYVCEGTINGGSGWVVTTPDPINLNTTAITFTQFSGAGQLVAGDGISILANTLSVRTTTRFTFTTGNLDVGATIAVTDGSNSFTVKQVYATPSNSTASINLPHGVVPGTPVDGDVWTTSGGLYVRVNGATLSLTPSTGTVTSVGLSLPAMFTVSNSPVTTSGTLTAVLATQVANTVFAGPATGVDAVPTFRAIVDADLPSTLTANARVAVALATTVIGTRRKINFIQGAGVTLTVTDDNANERVDVTIAAQGALAKYSVSVGDGVNTVYTVTHNLGSKDVVIRIFDNSTGNEVEPEVVHTSTTQATLTFAQIPTSNAYRVVVIG